MGKALVVGLTGGLGSGKSEALRALRGLGAATLCLDEVAHRVLAKGGPAYGPVRRAFGASVLGPDGEIDRRALGRAVFGDERRRRRLERLTHPAILREMRRRIRKFRRCRPDGRPYGRRRTVRERKRGLLVVDVPLLFEAGLEREFDLTVVVAAGQRARLARLRRRDGLPVSELRRRMTAQLPLAEKARRADVVIGNDGTRGELRRKIRDYHRAFELIYGG